MDLFIALQVVFMSMTAKPAFYHFYYYLVIALKKYYVINQGDNSIVHCSDTGSGKPYFT